MWLVVGLGNPGSRYSLTRHNLGSLVVDHLAIRWGHLRWSARLGGRLAVGGLAGEPVWLFMPLSYMNLSGDPVSRAVAASGADPARLLVVHDDVDLEFGRLKLKSGGGHGGHRGLGSIVDYLGRPQFPRLRVGAGRPAEGSLIDYVLGPFDEDQMRVLPAVLSRAADAVEAVLSEGLRPAANTYNGLPPPEL